MPKLKKIVEQHEEEVEEKPLVLQDAADALRVEARLNMTHAQAETFIKLVDLIEATLSSLNERLEAVEPK